MTNGRCYIQVSRIHFFERKKTVKHLRYDNSEVSINFLIKNVENFIVTSYYTDTSEVLNSTKCDFEELDAEEISDRY